LGGLLTQCQSNTVNATHNEGVTLGSAHPLNSGASVNSSLVRQLRSDRSAARPVWFMRQAGRSLPEYRKLRENYAMLESCVTPEVAAEITLQPVRRHGVDAAIFFSDIVVPFLLADIDVEIQAGVGPVIDHPVRHHRDLDRLRPLEPESLEPIAQAVSQVVHELGSTPLIAFGGAPFTLASYLIEGGPSKELPHTRAIMRDDHELWNAILQWCGDITAAFIAAQVQAGASALQLFDSWAGKLGADDYRQAAAPHSKALLAQLDHLVDDSGQRVPRIHFGLGTGEFLPDMVAVGVDAIGVDASLTLAQANEALGGKVPLQGNIDVSMLDAPWELLQAHIDQVLTAGAVAPGHVVNLSHGVPKDTDPGVLTKIVEYVHEATS
jgi:uroporphyrinogen decarboxylase